MFRCLLLLLLILVSSCAPYDPRAEHDLRPDRFINPPEKGVKVTFMGNSTLWISDGNTDLLVDGFLSRPSSLQTILGKIRPEPETIEAEMQRVGIRRIDALLIGHTHHDHALDAPTISRTMDAMVMGSESYGRIHQGDGGDPELKRLITVPAKGASRTFGKFTVTFVPSDHVSSHWLPQKKVEGAIEKPFRAPARYSNFKCGQVFALHIAHPDGNILVTTTAGAEAGRLIGREADVAFLGIGLLGKETPEKQEFYWRETVEAVNPKFVIPVHWDDFSRKLSKGLKPARRPIDDVEAAMKFVKSKAKGRNVKVLDYAESVLLRFGEVRFGAAQLNKPLSAEFRP